MLSQNKPKIMIWLKFTLSKDIIYIYSGKWNICKKNLQLYPLKRRRGPSFNQSWISLAKWCVVSNLVKIGRTVLEMKSKMWQNLQTDRQTDEQADRRTPEKWLRNLTWSWAFSSGEQKRQQSALVCGIRIKPTCKTLYLLFVYFDNSFGKKEYKK